MDDSKLLLSAVAIIALFSFYIMYNSEYSMNIISQCYSDSDCGWAIANCCSENSGARWKCVNERTFKPPECEKLILCPHVESPKPDVICGCVNGSCDVK